MKFFHDEGVVLRKHPVKEKDEVVILLTKTRGKIPMMAHGSRDPRGRKTAALELFNTVAFEAREPVGKKGESKDGLVTIQQTKLLKSRGFGVVGTGQTLDPFYRATEIVKMTDFFLQELHFIDHVYSDLNEALDLVECPAIELIYKTRLLTDLGYVPDWDTCCVCHTKLDLQTGLVFSEENKGFAHKECCLELSKPADKNLLKVTSFFQRESMSEAVKVELSAKLIELIRNVLDNVIIDN